MPGFHRTARARSAILVWAVGALLALAGLATAALEDISFGHEHVVGGQVVYHYHFHLGAHEHPDGDDDDHDGHDHDHHDHDGDHSIPDHHGAPRRAATIAASPALFQPLAISTPAVQPATLISLLPGVSAPVARRSVARLTDPRGPPFSHAVSGLLDATTNS
ncbi:MAG TPA: hypothetical protein VH988_33125 [Thermoanaerobaculia bacterium]|jgi:hypothetical protein|nr:hypothetical protein [Thermoanaerobaculia bacterium]